MQTNDECVQLNNPVFVSKAGFISVLSAVELQCNFNMASVKHEKLNNTKRNMNKPHMVQ